MLRVGILCSYRAPGLNWLLTSVPRTPRPYHIAACIASGTTFGDARTVVGHAVPLHLHPLRSFCQNRNVAFTDLTARREYDAETARVLKQHRVDLVVTDAYLYLLTAEMLDRYPRKIINLHHSDLTRQNGSGRARYVGLRAVSDAIFAGEPETRASAHLVTAPLDQGPAFVRSWSFPVAPLVTQAREWKATDILKAYAFAHQEWMIRATWGPLMDAALRVVAEGRVDLNALRSGDPIWELDEEGAVLSGSSGPSAAATRLARAG